MGEEDLTGMLEKISPSFSSNQMEIPSTPIIDMRPSPVISDSFAKSPAVDIKISPSTTDIRQVPSNISIAEIMDRTNMQPLPIMKEPSYLIQEYDKTRLNIDIVKDPTNMYFNQPDKLPEDGNKNN